MLFFSKLANLFFFPLPIALALLWTGCGLLWFTGRQKTGKVLATSGMLILTIISCGAFSKWLPGWLIERYPPALETGYRPGKPIKWVVVLSGGHHPQAGIPPNRQLSPVTLQRLVEGLRLYKAFPGSKLLVSGGSASERITNAETMAATALELGVPQTDLVVEDKSRDTEEQALLVQKRIGADPFILVTSGVHMPRSIGLFQKVGLNPIPAPADYRGRDKKSWAPTQLLPTAGNVYQLEKAWHEILGIWWAGWRGRM
jgi:uncharacterized SAM-binding protein YcdF (DUF218 family)